MRILNISLEKQLFIDNSGSSNRVKDYSRLFERFDLLVMTGRGFKPLRSEKMEIWPTNSLSKICYMHDAYYLGKKIIRQNQIDLISTQDPFETGFVGWLLARKFNIGLQLQVHGDFFGSPFWRKEKFNNRARYFLGKFILKQAVGVRAVSQRVRDSLLKLDIPGEKISVVPIYSELRVKNEELRIRQNDEFVFLTVGRLAKEKNIAMQIEAVAQIIKIFPKMELWIVGDGPEKESLEIKVKNLKLEKSVKFFGWRDDLKKFYEQADVFLLTSNYEGWGMVVIEAASFALPIVMTDVGCAEELIKDSESGILIPVGVQEKLIGAMRKLIVDEKLRDKLGKVAAELVAKLPDKEKSLEMYKEACSQAMKN